MAAEPPGTATPLGPAPCPMAGRSGSYVTITEGHNQRGKFAEPTARPGQQGAPSSRFSEVRPDRPRRWDGSIHWC